MLRFRKTRRLIIKLMIGLFFMPLSERLRAQDTEFWFTVPHLSETVVGTPPLPLNVPAFLAISNGTNQPANVVIRRYNGGSPIDTATTIAPGQLFQLHFPDLAAMKTIENSRLTAGTVTTYGMHITSDVPVSAYYMANSPPSRDIFTLKGQAALGTMFYVPMQDATNYEPTGYTSYAGACDQIDIVATEDNTTVTVVPKADVRIMTSPTTWTVSPAGTSIVEILNRGQTLKIMENTPNVGSLAGSSIVASAPVAVTVTEDLVSGDTSGDQIVPVSSVGKRYVIAKGYMTTATRERVYMVATASDTTTIIKVNNVTVFSGMNAGDVDVLVIQPPYGDVVYVEADFPIYCYQRTGYNEQGAALLPSMYSISQNKITYYQEPGAQYQKAFVIFKTGTENDFTITYNNDTYPLNIGAPINMPVPSITEWQCGRFDLPAGANGYAVTISNPQSKFSMGYIGAITSGNIMTFYGYLSQFGTLSFSDTTYLCDGSSVTLDAGYALSYEWTLPNGSNLTTPTITVTDTGTYTVVVDTDPMLQTASTRVLRRFEGSGIISSSASNMGAGTVTYTADPGLYPSTHVGYTWLVDGALAGIDSYFTDTWDADDEKLITLTVQDTVLGCSKTHTLIHRSMPDNISDSECYGTPPAQQWAITEIATASATNYNAAQTVLVADIDGDGIPELLTTNNINNDADTVYILDNMANVKHKFAIQTSLSNTLSLGAVARIKTSDSPEIYETLIFCLSYYTRLLYAYDTQGVLKWTSNQPYFSTSFATSILLVDLDGDGWSEVVAGNKVYAAESGILLLDLPGSSALNHGWATNRHLIHSSTGDVLANGRQQVCVGNAVFDVTITNRNSLVGNTYTMSSITPLMYDGSPITGDPTNGCTQVVDLDLDGYLDVVVSTVDIATLKCYVYVWSPVKNEIIASAILDNIYKKSVPFVGDIDGDGYPEIVFIHGRLPGNAIDLTTDRITALKYDTTSVNRQLSVFWQLGHYDTSGATAITLFDFNQDNIYELVYRDEDNLRIINGSKKSHVTGLDTVAVYDLATFPCKSATGFEYPVIADIDGDGQAEIIVTGPETGVGLVPDGPVRIFKAGAGTSWAPARKVWNQISYNAVNINEDLTVPRFPLNPATVFPGLDGILGTPDDVHPYNAFLQQQTVLTKDGTPLWLLPNIVWTSGPTATLDGDSLIIDGCITNFGDAALHNQIYITVYQNDTTTTANIILFDSIAGSLLSDSSACFSLAIKDLHLIAPASAFWVSVNDRNGVYPFQEQCTLDGRYKSDVVLKQAADDYVQFLACRTDSLLNVLLNDTMILCPRSAIDLFITSDSKVGATTLIDVNKDIIYTLPAGFTGRDTLEYIAVCADTIYTAKAYILVADCPDNIDDADCVGMPPSTTFSFDLLASSLETVSDIVIPLVGDIDGDGKVEIIAAIPHASILSADTIRIFEMKGDTISLQQTLSTPYFNIVGNCYAVANVDGGNSAAIFIATGTSGNLAGDQRYLIKYIYDGTQYIEGARSTEQYSLIASKENAQPMIVDFNGDGIAEVVLYDKVYNAITLELLADGGYLGTSDMGGFGGHHNNNYSTTELTSVMAVADIDGDGVPEVIGGNSVYKVNIVNPNGLAGNSFTLFNQASTAGRTDIRDGTTAVADMDGDGLLDVIVATTSPSPAAQATLYIWNPRTGEIMNDNVINIPRYSSATGIFGVSTPFIGDIDSDGMPDICLTGAYVMRAYGYDTATKQLMLKWDRSTTDESGATTMSMFDFDQDGSAELVYRDRTHLRILNGADGSDLITQIPCASVTAMEYPVVADVNGDGNAEIIVTGGTGGAGTGYVRIYASKPAGLWAPARKVWNQYAYNVVNVNDNLTVPKYQMNPATTFPNGKQPFNAYLMQQTMLNKNGDPLWLLPDVYTNSSLVRTSSSGNAVTVTVDIVNRGEAAIGPPVYVALYRENSSQIYTSADTIATVCVDTLRIMPDSTRQVTIHIPDITDFFPMANIVIRLNDDGLGTFPYQAECDTDNDTLTIVNPALHLMMEKDAVLNTVYHNGLLSNPVTVLHGENIEYTITAVNASVDHSTLVIRDTLPAYLDFVSSLPAYTATGSIPPRVFFEWTISGLSHLASTSVVVEATPQPGVSASQPLFENRAWVTVNDTISVPTNYTYHQGAGVSVTTFSSGFGGSIYNASQQALDYRTFPRSGIVIVPDEGYVFAGWSHADYLSLRGERIRAQRGIMRYDTLTVYGDVTLRADFEPENYAIIYHLHGGHFPSVIAGDEAICYQFSIESPDIALVTPEKEGDVFTGWTGSNGDEPQQQVTIPAGSTGERIYYANYLHSGRAIDIQPADDPAEDRIWAVENELYVRTTKPGSILRIYSLDGVQQRQQIILQAGESKYRLPGGLYIVSLNNGIGRKVVISD